MMMYIRKCTLSVIQRQAIFKIVSIHSINIKNTFVSRYRFFGEIRRKWILEKWKFYFFFVLLSDAEIIAKEIDDYPLTKSCYVQYLREKGKLEELLPSTEQPSSRCRFVNPYLESIFIDSIADKFSPKDADCIKNVLAISELYDYLLKFYVINSGFFRDAEKLISRSGSPS